MKDTDFNKFIVAGRLPLKYDLKKRLWHELKTNRLLVFNRFSLARRFPLTFFSHISTKRDKSVFYSKGRYFNVYRYQNPHMLRALEFHCAHKPVRQYGKNILMFSEIQPAEDISYQRISEIIDSYSSKTMSDVPLVNLLENSFRSNRCVRLARIIVGEFQPEKKIENCICHGDLTRENIRSEGGKIKIIDWDDAFVFTKSYDKIYFQLMEKLQSSNESGYLSVLNMLGLRNRHFDIDQAVQKLISLCTGNFPVFEYKLFIAKFLDEAISISPSTRFIWSQVKGINCEGDRYVFQSGI